MNTAHSQGISESQVVDHWLSVDTMLRSGTATQKKQFIQALANDFNIDLTTDAEDEYADPTEQAVQRAIASIHSATE